MKSQHISLVFLVLAFAGAAIGLLYHLITWFPLYVMLTPQPRSVSAQIVITEAVAAPFWQTTVFYLPLLFVAVALPLDISRWKKPFTIATVSLTLVYFSVPHLTAVWLEQFTNTAEQGAAADP